MSDINAEDIRAAVGSGLLSERQAASLMAMAHSRRGARESLVESDEPFELFKGFNEIFIVIGMLILASGWAATTVTISAISGDTVKTPFILSSMIAAFAVWVLSEYFIRRRRMIAPAIALSVLWLFSVGIGFSTLLLHSPGFEDPPVAQQLLTVGLVTASVAVFWARFRVPFSIALIAVGLFAFALLLGSSTQSNTTNFSDLFLLSANGPLAWITVFVGLGVFATAMRFDLSDPHRVTRRAAQGFWLHVVAAPALINTFALSLLQQKAATANLVLLAMLLAFALVAIVIDRRSFLIAAIGYCVTLTFTVLDGDGAALSILVLGVGLVALGAFWTQIRAAILSLLPKFVPLDRLPPSH